MSRLAKQAELLKLARFLDVEPAELSALAPVAADDVRALREQVTRASFANDDAFFKRVVAASKLLPVPVLAMVAEKVLGPLLSARVAGQMDVKRGVGIAGRLPPKFLADVCLSLDPGHTRELIAAIPVEQIVKVALELARREEHVTMGRFVDIIGDQAIRAVLDAITDNAHLLRIAFFAENKHRLDAIIGLLSEARLVEVIHTAASSADLWPEALGLMQHLSPAVRGRLGDLAAGLEEEVLTSMAVSIRAHGLWGDALPIVSSMSEVSKARFANLPAVQDEAMLTDILLAAGRYGVWPELLPLVRLMDQDGKARCARVAEHLDGEQLLQIAEVAAAHALWPEMIELVALMQPQLRLDTMALLGIAPARVVESLVPAIEQTQSWALINEAWPRMGAGARDRLIAVAQAAGLADRIAPQAESAAPMPITPRAAAAAGAGAAGAVDWRPVLAQLEQHAAAFTSQQAVADEGLERLAAQQRRLADTLAAVQEQNARMQQEQSGLRGAITVLTLVSGVAMMFVAAAIVLLVTQVMFRSP